MHTVATVRCMGCTEENDTDKGVIESSAREEAEYFGMGTSALAGGATATAAIRKDDNKF
jgi:hypothetical protein